MRRAHMRGDYWGKRVKTIQHWSDHLDFLRDGAKGAQRPVGKAKTGKLRHDKSDPTLSYPLASR